jgi:hypothetical protein
MLIPNKIYSFNRPDSHLWIGGDEGYNLGKIEVFYLLNIKQRQDDEWEYVDLTVLVKEGIFEVYGVPKGWLKYFYEIV